MCTAWCCGGWKEESAGRVTEEVAEVVQAGMGEGLVLGLIGGEAPGAAPSALRAQDRVGLTTRQRGRVQCHLRCLASRTASTRHQTREWDALSGTRTCRYPKYYTAVAELASTIDKATSMQGTTAWLPPAPGSRPTHICHAHTCLGLLLPSSPSTPPQFAVHSSILVASSLFILYNQFGVLRDPLGPLTARRHQC